MARRRQCVALLLCATLFVAPVFGSPASGLGTLVYAERAHLGPSAASAGSTVFGGDRLSTETSGSVQVRVGGARFLLHGTSSAILLQDPGSPAAVLTSGSATFSTANANAFVLHALAAVIKPNSDGPTIGQVSVLGKNELLVKSVRGALACTVDGETRVIPEGEGYRVVFDASDAAPMAAQGPAGSGGHGPRKAGKNKAVYYIVGATAVVTFFFVQEALESPDRP